MSKYKERAYQILDEQDNPDNVIKAMCQLAEEVEITYELIQQGKVKDVYTKQQVEELLQKQRELCAEACSPFSGDYDSILNAKLNLGDL